MFVELSESGSDGRGRQLCGRRLRLEALRETCLTQATFLQHGGPQMSSRRREWFTVAYRNCAERQRKWICKGRERGKHDSLSLTRAQTQGRYNETRKNRKRNSKGNCKAENFESLIRQLEVRLAAEHENLKAWELFENKQCTKMSI